MVPARHQIWTGRSDLSNCGIGYASYSSEISQRRVVCIERFSRMSCCGVRLQSASRSTSPLGSHLDGTTDVLLCQQRVTFFMVRGLAQLIGQRAAEARCLECRIRGRVLEVTCQMLSATCSGHMFSTSLSFRLGRPLNSDTEVSPRPPLEDC